MPYKTVNVGTPFKPVMEQQWAGPTVTPDVSEGFDALVKNYNAAYGAAKSANEARYQQALDLVRSSYDTALSSSNAGYSKALAAMDSTSGQQGADIRSTYAQEGADITQRLAKLGMSNTTVAPTMQLGVKDRETSALNRLADLFSQQKAGLFERQGASTAAMQSEKGKQMAGITERRVDAYPDAAGTQAIIAGMGSQYGAGGGGMGAMLKAFAGMRY